jgi:hypothetical protein
LFICFPFVLMLCFDEGKLLRHVFRTSASPGKTIYCNCCGYRRRCPEVLYGHPGVPR